MLALITFFLVALIVSTTAIWLYRFISDWKGFNQITVGKPAANTGGWFKAQRGFGSIASATRRRTKPIVLSNTRGEIKVPWGW